MSWLINILFKWESLRTAIFAEVDWHNNLGLILEDKESMKTAALMWYETDGWRGWTIKDNGSYYFHDIPEKSLVDLSYIFGEEDERM